MKNLPRAVSSVAAIVFSLLTLPLPVTAFQDDAASPLASRYRKTAALLTGEALTDRDGYRKLTWLCDRIGHRLAGSEALNQAIAWAAAEMRKDGLSNVRTQPVTVPHWVRGRESLELLAPVKRSLPLLGLGLSVGTPAEGITAPVVVVRSFDELDKLGEARVRGKIVVYNVPFQGYGATVAYRSSGPSRAAQLGAVAVLVRAVGSATLRTPHTGALSYQEGAPKIPAASIAPEDAMQLDRMAASGETVTVKLSMEAKMLDPAPSHNVMGEIPGREKPEEIVVLGGHIDSWDVGQGAQDDGSGCVAAMQALALIRKLGLQPRRTLRVVLWTNEENGLAGGRAYREALGADVNKHVAAIEMDGGAEKPVGFDTTLRDPQQLALARQIASLLEGIGASSIREGGGGADISPLTRAGVPGFGLRTVGLRYFDWHHTDADTLDKIDPNEFRLNIATLAVFAYVLADMEERIPVQPETAGGRRPR